MNRASGTYVITTNIAKSKEKNYIMLEKGQLTKMTVYQSELYISTAELQNA